MGRRIRPDAGGVVHRPQRAVEDRPLVARQAADHRRHQAGQRCELGGQADVTDGPGQGERVEAPARAELQIRPTQLGGESPVVAQRVDRILAAAKALGIAEKDIKSVGYNIAPQYAYDQGKAPRITGYQATQMLQLTLRTIDDAGKALDKLVQNDGATNASISFSIEDPKAAQADARKLAIDDARSKADAMARTAGVRLGRVLAITDGSPAPTPLDGARFMPVAAPMPTASLPQIPAGDMQIVVRVQVQFEIQ